MLDTIIFASLALGQAELPASPQYLTQYQKPPIYAQAEDLGTRLLKEADAIAKNNPILAVSHYDIIVMQYPNSNYAAEAYLKSGKILCDLLFEAPSRFDEGIQRLEKAYSLGNNEVKARARLKQAFMENLIGGGVNIPGYRHILGNYGREMAVKHLKEVIKLAPRTKEAQMAENLLETLSIKHFR